MAKVTVLASISALSLLLVGCLVSSPGPREPAPPVNPGDPPPPADPAPPPAPPVDPPPVDPVTPPPADPVAPPVARPGANGAACSLARDCRSGVCEGQGCGAGAGKCVARQRMCTKDYRPYCGCDGKTFHGSGSCPGKTFAYRGECKSPTKPPAKKVVGAKCSAANECQSGMCEGQGCGTNMGTCVAKKRPCTMDLRAYCGCDGKTFRGSGTCPGKLFAHRGECKSAKKADGAKCSTASECQSGTCEGKGCGANSGVCAPLRRACTRDRRPYCGCDGKTFFSSSRCPGQRFAYSGKCVTKAADGAACSVAADCMSGTCEGLGCGDKNGKCAPQRRACTRDLRAYCGCDGKTFHGSGSCPGERFSKRGECSPKIR